MRSLEGLNIQWFFLEYVHPINNRIGRPNISGLRLSPDSPSNSNVIDFLYYTPLGQMLLPVSK